MKRLMNNTILLIGAKAALLTPKNLTVRSNNVIFLSDNEKNKMKGDELAEAESFACGAICEVINEILNESRESIIKRAVDRIETLIRTSTYVLDKRIGKGDLLK